MSGSVTRQIIDGHLVSGEPVAGTEIGLEIDQSLMVDTSGTMVWLQFEAMGLSEVEPDPTVVYADHQAYQFDWRNSDDHRFLQSAADRYGANFSKPGNGICHQIHKEQFAVPGRTLLGADSHTPTAGGFGMLAFGAGGLDVTVALAGGAYYLEMPEIVEVRLDGELPDWVGAKDVILELLRRESVSGGVGKIFEYTGPGVSSLSVHDRCVITNMGTELGATTSVFPSDDRTRSYLERLGRAEDFVELQPATGAAYDAHLEIDLSALEPMVACPSMPDNVVPIGDVEGTPVEQVIVGSCTNGAYEDIRTFGGPLGEHSVADAVHAVVAPASKRAAEVLAREGTLADLMAAGVNWSESTCGACIGMGHVPPSGAASLRTFNRNFEGRSGIEDDAVYLSSPAVAGVTAVTGELTDPRDFAASYGLEPPATSIPDSYSRANTDIVTPTGHRDLEKGPNIGSVPLKDPLQPTVTGKVLLTMGDNVTTDHILPGRSDILMYRSNVEKLAEFTLERIDETFADRAAAVDGGFLVAGENYGLGSSREHAALCPMYLGVHGILARSFGRIHKTNLINYGLLPLEFAEPGQYGNLERGDELRVTNLDAATRTGGAVTIENETTGNSFRVTLDASERERDILRAGGRLPYTKLQRG